MSYRPGKMYFCGHIFGGASIRPQKSLASRAGIIRARNSHFKEKKMHNVPISPVKEHNYESRHPQHCWQELFG